VGAGFGLMVRRQRCAPSETVFLGAAYGALWWCIGPLTLLPLALGQAPAWDVAAAQREFPSLLGHLVFGMGTALVFVVLHGPGDPGRVRRPVGVGTLVRGLLAGLLAALALRAVLHGRAPAVVPAIAVGLAQAALSPRSDQGIGAALVPGQGYGFLAWVVGELTVLPLLADAGLRWSLPEARASFPDLPGWLLLGALAAASGPALGPPVRPGPGRPGSAAAPRAPARLRGRGRGQRRAGRGPAGGGGGAARRGGDQAADAGGGGARGRPAATANP